MIQRRILSGVAGVGVLAMALVGCSDGGSGASSTANGESAGPVTLTMWTRSVTAVQSQALVDAFNTEQNGKIKIALTVVPFADYLQKVSAAASGHNLPDLLAANVIDGPNYSKLGLWSDITARVDALPFKDTLAPAHIAAATTGGSVFAVPHVLDASSLYYNKVLFEKAGLDPQAPPTTLREVSGAIPPMAKYALPNTLSPWPASSADCWLYARKSVSAISRLLSPAAIASRMSSSLGVRPSCSTRAWFRTNGPLAGTGTRTSTGTSLVITVSRGRVSLRPSQMPSAEKIAAMMPP